jgi:hypothetical protein
VLLDFFSHQILSLTHTTLSAQHPSRCQGTTRPTRRTESMTARSTFTSSPVRETDPFPTLPASSSDRHSTQHFATFSVGMVRRRRRLLTGPVTLGGAAHTSCLVATTGTWEGCLVATNGTWEEYSVSSFTITNAVMSSEQCGKRAACTCLSHCTILAVAWCLTHESSFALIPLTAEYSHPPMLAAAFFRTTASYAYRHRRRCRHNSHLD